MDLIRDTPGADKNIIDDHLAKIPTHLHSEIARHIHADYTADISIIINFFNEQNMEQIKAYCDLLTYLKSFSIFKTTCEEHIDEVYNALQKSIYNMINQVIPFQGKDPDDVIIKFKILLLLKPMEIGNVIYERNELLSIYGYDPDFRSGIGDVIFWDTMLKVIAGVHEEYEFDS